MAKEPKPVEQQIEEYKKEFEYFTAIQRELDAYRKVDQERIDFLKNYFNGKKAYK